MDSWRMICGREDLLPTISSSSTTLKSCRVGSSTEGSKQGRLNIIPTGITCHLNLRMVNEPRATVRLVSDTYWSGKLYFANISTTFYTRLSIAVQGGDIGVKRYATGACCLDLNWWNNTWCQFVGFFTLPHHCEHFCCHGWISCNLVHCAMPQWCLQGQGVCRQWRCCSSWISVSPKIRDLWNLTILSPIA
jgi:hypothetical protein